MEERKNVTSFGPFPELAHLFYFSLLMKLNRTQEQKT